MSSERMDLMDCFYSITDERRNELKIKRSTFICAMKYVAHVEEAKAFISAVSSEHKNATHNCWAYIVGEHGEMFHSSDNGEPAGTAGKPMLNALQSETMTQIVAVVTRYFGGVKLGIRGLIDAYGEAVTHTIAMAPLKKLIKTQNFIVELPYGFNDTLLHQLQSFPAEVTETRYSDMVSHDIQVEESSADALETMLSSWQGAGKLTYLTEDE